MASRARFEYMPLDADRNEIRLLHLSPNHGFGAAGGQRIRCRLVHTSLDEHPKYEALSYTWGNQNGTQNILLDGCDFTITRNLEEMLIKFRSLVPKTLWIDAICINQEDIEERNSQVTKMRVIYSKASRVRIWLGPQGEKSELAFKLLHQLRDKITDKASVEKILHHPRNHQNLSAIIKLFGRDYWSRVWVVQEVECAHDVIVHCGGDSISWSDITTVQEEVVAHHELALDDAALANADLSYLSNHFMHFGPRMLKLDKENKKGLLDLFDVLDSHFGKKSTDPRDHIYGVIGLTAARENAMLQIDYSKSVYQLFTEVTGYIISTTHNLDVLCSRPVFAIFDSISKTPSWVADWATSFDGGLLPTYFNAAGTTLAVAECDISKGILRVEGICIGRIKFYGKKSNMEDVDDQKEALIALCKWHKLLRTQYDNGYRGWDPFIRTLSVTRKPKDEELTGEFSTSRWAGEAKEIVQRCQQLCPEAVEGDMLRCIPTPKGSEILGKRHGMNFYQSVTDVIYRRKFFISESRLLGVGPETLRENDFICILFGCRYPVILRSKASYYLLLGPAYVDKYMWGRAIAEMEDGRFNLQNFEIH